MSTTRISDEELVRFYLATQENDYFAQLYTRYVKKVFRRCLTLTKDPTDAEDFTQDIFVRVLSGLNSFQGKSSFSTWLYTISTNYCMDRMKMNRKRACIELDPELIKTLADKNDQALWEERYQLVEKVITKICPDEAQYLQMKYVQNMDIKQIACLMNIKDSAVKMRLKRVRDKVRILVHRHQSY